MALDCAGLVVAVAQAIGAEYVDRTGYSRSPSHGQLQCALDEQPCLSVLLRWTASRAYALLIRFAGDPRASGDPGGRDDHPQLCLGFQGPRAPAVIGMGRAHRLRVSIQGIGMSTGGQAIGGVLGAVGGFFVAGPKGALYGARIGIAIGTSIRPRGR
ncbi:hypothetical protein [Propionivibrio sp.]|uniref:hypothetical protein n=1 Tax=Propionivibrio sp. TaxID=2212460 RepID=UPI0025FEC8FA|nr:hypothetical protein [Propionivibrio sp.]MBK8745490.1 hypothetical protein [Propionivibrio sp.]